MNFNKIENFLIFTEPILNKNVLARFLFCNYTNHHKKYTNNFCRTLSLNLRDITRGVAL